LLPIQFFHYGEGRCYLSLTLLNTGAGLNGILTGGEKPHIGGIALAIPRPSLTGEGWSSDLYLTPVPQHKDVELAGPLAEKLARLIRQPVVITAGVHCDALTMDELLTIQENYKYLTEMILRSLE
jgi:gallate decarboxylase subunit D